MDSSNKIKWFKQSDTQWQTRDHRGYVGTIDYAPGANPYQLTVTPGPVVTTYKTLGRAKNGYRRFLHDKPVNI